MMSAVSSSKPKEAVSTFDFPKKSRLATEVDQLARERLKREGTFADLNPAPKKRKISATKQSSSPAPLATTAAAASTTATEEADPLELALGAHKACTLLQGLDGAKFTFPKSVIVSLFNPFTSETDPQPYIQAVLTWASQKLAGGTFSRNQICEMFVNDMRQEMGEFLKEERFYELMVILLAMFEYPFGQCGKRTDSSVAVAQKHIQFRVPSNKSIDHLTKALNVYIELTDRLFSSKNPSEVKFKFPDQKELASRLERFVSYEPAEKKAWSKFVRDWALKTLPEGTFNRNQICKMVVERIKNDAKLSTNSRANYERILIFLATFELPLLRCANRETTPAATTAAAASK